MKNRQGKDLKTIRTIATNWIWGELQENKANQLELKNATKIDETEEKIVWEPKKNQGLKTKDRN